MKHGLALAAVVLTLSAATPAPAHEQLGSVTFATSCAPGVQPQFNRAVALLHSFWFQAALAGFADVAKADPSCAMAHWGTAVTWLGNPLAAPPTPKGLQEGWAAVERAKAAGAKTQRERDYIAAIEAFYKDADKVDHKTRALAYEKAMEALAARYPDDREAAVFYALSLNVTLNPADKTYANQLKAAAILEPVFAAQPNHPGVAHYLIHSYDFPPIAQKGLPAARRYAAIAPSAPHALHMPSHIFTRVGAWQESIDSNRASAVAAKDELSSQGQQALGSYNALHAMDYMVYGYSPAREGRRGARWSSRRSAGSRSSTSSTSRRPSPSRPSPPAMPWSGASGRTRRASRSIRPSSAGTSSRWPSPSRGSRAGSARRGAATSPTRAGTPSGSPPCGTVWPRRRTPTGRSRARSSASR